MKRTPGSFKRTPGSFKRTPGHPEGLIKEPGPPATSQTMLDTPTLRRLGSPTRRRLSARFSPGSSADSDPRDPGILLKDPGILLKEPGVLLKDPGVLQKDHGVLLKDPGVLLKDPGVPPAADPAQIVPYYAINRSRRLPEGGLAEGGLGFG